MPEGVHDPRRDTRGEAESCRLARDVATLARDTAREVLHDVVRACHAASLPPERVIRLMREMMRVITHTTPGLSDDLAMQLDAEVVQWTIAAYYRPG